MGRDAQPTHGEGQQIPSPEVYALCLRSEAPHSVSRTLGRSREHPGVLHADAETGGSELAKSREPRLSLSLMPLNPGGRNTCATRSAPAATMRHQEFGVSDWWCHPRGCDRRGTCSSLPPPTLLHPILPPRHPRVTALLTLGFAYLLLGLSSPWSTCSLQAGAVAGLSCPKGQVTAVCRSQRMSVLLVKKYTWGCKLLVCKFRMKGQR